MIVSIVGACLVGGMANLLRVTAGRARPDSRNYEQGFHGPTIKSQKHSFPSGHTATSFGAAIPVAIAAPPLGVPLVVAAGGIAWSRLFNNKHHPTDVIASILLACLIGIPLGCAARRLRREGITGEA
jgi:membrane-associated phospholipid phosphatase